MLRTSVLTRCLGVALVMALASCGEDAGPGATGGSGGGVADASGQLDSFVGDALFGSDTGRAAQDSGTAVQDTGSGGTAEDSGSAAQDSGNTAPDTGGGGASSCVGKCGEYKTGAPCQCDSGCVKLGDCCTDYAAVCGGGDDASSSSGADAGTSDPDIGSDPDTGSSSGSDAAGGGGSCLDKCGKYTSGAACQCDSGCEGYGDCCADYKKLCAKPACKEDKDCDDQLSCTKDSCDKVKGECVHKTDDGFCNIDKNCYKAKETGDSACMVCDPDKSSDDWTINSGDVCDDGNSCTTNDRCNESGACVGTKTANCCTKNSDCDTGDACKTGTCDLQAGTCKTQTKADCCSSGACCDLAENKVKKKATQCGTEVASEEYKCKGSEIQTRQAYHGCDGNKTACNTAKSYYHWTPWKSVHTCKEGSKCVQSGTGKPKCEAPTTCKTATDCDDNNPCTKDICAGGKCSHELIAGCCNFASDCDDGNKCTTELCDNNTCSSTAIPCKGSSDCELASCDPQTGACNVKVKAGFCKIADACVPDGKLKDGENCLACNSKVNQSEWSPAAKCACKSGVCCDTNSGIIKPKASQCSDKIELNKYRCTKDGGAIEVSDAYRGCTGKSNTCSISKSNYHWTAWKQYKKCGSNQFCEVADESKPGVCKDKVATQCSGTTCCINGKLAPQKTKCSNSVLKSQYKCSSTTMKGAKIQRRQAYRGCTGKSTTCSSAADNLSWTSWSTIVTCKSNQVCKPGTSSFITPTCVTAQQCKPGTTCCTSTGNYASQKTKCGIAILASKYSCTSDKLGSDVLVSRAYGGCTGKSTSCSYTTTNWHWSKPTTYKDCKTPAKCLVSSVSKPGVCSTGGGVACDKYDKWEPGSTTSKALTFGSFNDNTSAKVLTPKMHFKSDSDLDFIKYKIQDTSATYRPAVHVEWSAPAAMNLCAWYACDKGVGGKNCKPITCPAGFKAQQNSAVSGEKLNGCCTSMWKPSGVLHFEPRATSGTNHSGWVYFSGRNAAPLCQEANIKLQFGVKTSTPCNPGTTCCTSTGQLAPQKTKCGTKIEASEYRCSSNKLQVRRAYRGCIGSSAYCSISKSNWYWSPYITTKTCSSTEVCSVTDKTKPGSCVPKADAVCKLYDKYAPGLYYSSAYNLGSYSDSSSAKNLVPDIIFNSAYDSEYFRWDIKDNVNSTNPRAHIEFEGADNVQMCLYYRCYKGSGGKNCAPVKCPAGSSPSYRSYVSSTNPNGCCMTAKKATLSFSPDAAGTTDESGRVYLYARNTGKVCQKVKAKLVFGSKTATQCTPGTKCCTSAGTYAPKRTKCGTTTLQTQYRCSSTSNGGDVQRRRSFAGCVGTSTFCSSSSTNQYWEAWATYKNCTSTQVCSVPDPSKPGECKTAINPLCSKYDKYASGAYFSSAYNLGTYDDTSSAKILSPKVLFNSKTDSEYFRYKINDKFNTTSPQVNVEWQGADKVTVCAYYRCEKGTNGKDCKPVSCPAGSSPSSTFYVSATSPNGCCATATKGKIQFTPDAPGTTDDTGIAYLHFYNASNVCQEVYTKLQFGNKSATQCNPSSSCCGQDGQYLPKGTKCGTTALTKQYKCSSTSYGGDVLVREAYAGCTGFSGTTCTTSTSYRHWTSWKVLNNCTSTQVCSVPDSSKPGICKNAGSFAPLCKVSDKYESGKYYSSAFNLGTFKDNSKAIVLTPDTHMGSTSDIDYYKWSISDSSILNEPRVRVSWTAAEPVYVCAWYACNNGANGKNCEKVSCKKGSVSYSSSVSGTIYNGCCSTAAKGEIDFSPNAPGTNETGWAYLRLWNKAKICQYVNTKIEFGGSSTVCGDGIKAFGESTTSCKADQGSCVGKCGAKYDAAAPCQCDSKCVSIGDCCWDQNIYCAN